MSVARTDANLPHLTIPMLQELLGPGLPRREWDSQAGLERVACGLQ
jgi:hypothetical protein